MADARELTYAFHGASSGPTIVVLDGPGSRGMALAGAPAAAELGGRLLAIDRPGFGGSTPAGSRGIAEWPASASSSSTSSRSTESESGLSRGGLPTGWRSRPRLPSG